MKKILLGDELLIIFSRIGSHTFGVDINHVVSIIEPSQTRVVPLAPTHINTILNSHGKIITVFDIYEYLEYTAKVENAEPKIIYLKSSEQHIGLLVDKVDGIDYITPSCVEPCPANGAGKSEADFCKEIFLVDENSAGIYWLDTAKIEGFIRDMKFSSVNG